MVKSEIYFSKMHGNGNDFVVIDTRTIKHTSWSSLAKKMCDRHFGIGADGLILVLNSKKADLRMRIINSDGSEAETCGNGLRCFAKFVSDNRIMCNNQFTIETPAGINPVKIYRDRGDRVQKVKVMMSVPQFAASKIPVVSGDLILKKGAHFKYEYNEISLVADKRKLRLAFVSMGNPHAIFFTDKPLNDFPLAVIGPAIEHNVIFPERTNFEVARVVNRKKIELRVWERGVGETLACGSGACAVAVMAMIKGYVDEIVDIKLPGGILTIKWTGHGGIAMTGAAKQVFTGIWL